MPIIMDIHKEEEIQNIWGVRGQDTASIEYDYDRPKKKESKKSEKKYVKDAKVASIQNEQDYQTKVREMEIEGRYSQFADEIVADTTELIWSTTPNPQTSLS